MRLEAIVVCVNYSDFLEHTLPENMKYFDRVVVVTSPEDRATQALCNRLGVDFIETTVFYEYGDKFNKGKGIGLGLSHLRHDGWLLHLDADTLLPHGFRAMLEHARLDPKCIYGADRLNVVGFDRYTAMKDKLLSPQFQYRYLVTPPPGLTLGARLLHKEYGYCPIGYFQLWHSSARRTYPIHQGSAEHTDVLFAVQWPREKRVLLPELFVFHLESESAKMGANWSGRTTPFFGDEKKKS